MVAAAAAASTVRAMADDLPAAPQQDQEQPSPETARFDAWNARMERPLLLAAVVFVVVLCLPILVTDLPGPVKLAVRATNLGIWGLFTLDYVVRLRLSPDRRAFVRTHLLDLFIVVVPFFRPLRLLRLLSVANRMGRQNRGNLVADVSKLVTGAAVLTAFLGAVLALDVERDAQDSVITNFADALWWAVGTMTAVPYGDVYPVTQQGRVISGVLMVLGLVLVGLITAAIAAWFVQYIGHEEELEEALASESAALQAVHERLAAMEALLADLAGRPVPPQRKGPSPR